MDTTVHFILSLLWSILLPIASLSLLSLKDFHVTLTCSARAPGLTPAAMPCGLPGKDTGQQQQTSLRKIESGQT